MMTFLTYEYKVAVALLVFYLFYRFLLKKETFHRFNRIMLVGTAVLSFVLPLCIITIHKPMEMASVDMESVAASTAPTSAAAAPVSTAPSGPWWPTALTILFFTGVAFVLFRLVISIFCILRIVRQGKCVGEEDGCKIIITERDVAPFSWMKYIVLSREDWEGPHAPIIAHEKAHIAYGHSKDLLLVDILSVFQWFNPAIWMLHSDLRELHEYEADDAVLRGGTNIKEYQYLLIRKAVSKSGYSVANSFNHSILKNRITMMSKSRSPLARGLRALYVLPLACLGIGLQAQTVYVPRDKDNVKFVKSDGTKASNTLELTIKADGTVSTGEKVIPLTDLVTYLRDAEALGPDTAVRLSVENDVPMGPIEDAMEELRKVGARKVMFYAAGLPSIIPMMPLRATPTSAKNDKYPEEVLPGVNRENICMARLNKNDKIFFDDGAYADDDVIVRHGVEFIEKHGNDARFVMRNSRASSFGAYMHLQNLILRAYDEARDAKAKAIYGKPMSELTIEEGNEIRWLIPYAISKTESKD